MVSIGLSRSGKARYCSPVEQQEAWSGRFAEAIGKRVAHFREQATDEKGRRMSAQALADRCAKLGHRLDRSVIAKLERGLRQTVTVADVIVLARALNVPPLLLVLPVGQEEMTEVLPGHDAPTWPAATWFTGEAPFPGSDPSVYVIGEDDQPDPGFDAGAAPLRLFRDHARYLEEREAAWLAAQAATADTRREAAAVRREAAQAAAQATADAYRYVRLLDAQIRQTRAAMRKRGLLPPPLPRYLERLNGPRPDLEMQAWVEERSRSRYLSGEDDPEPTP